MIKKLLSLAVAAAFGQAPVSSTPRGRSKTRDVAFTYRMGAGFPGDINRTHPAEVEAAVVASVPPTAYGQPVLIENASQGIRPFQAGDVAVIMPWGFTVRPFPTQQQSGGMTASLGAATPPTSGVMDVMRQGLMMTQLNDIAATPKKGDPVFVWCAATAGVHKQGGIEVIASGGNTAALDPNKFQFNGTPDSAGVVEISCNV